MIGMDTLEKIKELWKQESKEYCKEVIDPVIIEQLINAYDKERNSLYAEEENLDNI